MFTQDMFPNTATTKMSLVEFFRASKDKSVGKDDVAEVISVTAHDSDDDLSCFTEYEEEDVVNITVTQTCMLSVDSDDCSTASSTGSYSVLPEVVDTAEPEPKTTKSVRSTRTKKERASKFVKQSFKPKDKPSKKASVPCPNSDLCTEDRQALWLVWSTLQIHADKVQRMDNKGVVGKLMLRRLYMWHPKRVRKVLQCPPEGKGGILADMARHILALKIASVCTNILLEMVHHDVIDIARALVKGMQDFLTSAMPDVSLEHHNATSPNDWSLLARAWTESMEECHADMWTPRIAEAWYEIEAHTM